MLVHFKGAVIRKGVHIPDNSTIRDMIGIIGLGNFWGCKVLIDGNDINMHETLTGQNDKYLDRLVADFSNATNECCVTAVRECGWNP